MGASICATSCVLLFALKSFADPGSFVQAEDGGRRRLLLSGDVKEDSLGAKPRCPGLDRGIPGRLCHRIFPSLTLDRSTP